MDNRKCLQKRKHIKEEETEDSAEVSQYQPGHSPGSSSSRPLFPLKTRRIEAFHEGLRILLPADTLHCLQEETQGSEGHEPGEPCPVCRMPKQHKLWVCQICGQPAQADFGHSQYMAGSSREVFYAMFEGKTVEVWLAERRAGRREDGPAPDSAQ
ncbi:prophage side tail fiber protein homolog StfR-like [Xyrichtys novacula]|uniref:Prophage side tail fiber protein homolog StfR-like n=1 Tax=Xyrichtys novacula TaxID=13765 RepID=A0AAV1EIQ0_XYRNO|nr:prophage side tail fiber protein homolog StfR-like [Xyrichtys novacula]